MYASSYRSEMALKSHPVQTGIEAYHHSFVLFETTSLAGVSGFWQRALT
jgi:hypothetical protein